jgi:hypothetical protein
MCFKFWRKVRLKKCALLCHFILIFWRCVLITWIPKQYQVGYVAVTLQIPNMKTPSSNLARDAYCLVYVFQGFPQYLQKNLKVLIASFLILLARHSWSSSAIDTVYHVYLKEHPSILGSKMFLGMWKNVSTTKYVQHYLLVLCNSGAVLQVVRDLALLMYPHINTTLSFVILLSISLPLLNYQLPQFILLSFNHIYIA